MDLITVLWIVSIVMYLEGALTSGFTLLLTKAPKPMLVLGILLWPILLPIWLVILWRKYGEIAMGILRTFSSL